MERKIEFYFDFLSPYSYMAWTQIRELDWNIEYKPVSVPNVIAHYETLGPGQIKPKRDYLMKDLLRYKTINQIPFKVPTQLPFNSLYALRIVLQAKNNEEAKVLTNLFFRASWELGLDIGNTQLISDLLNENGFKAEELIDRTSSKEIKESLRNNINEAIQKGVFGVPSFIIDNELFWGNDSLKYVFMYLANKDPLPKQEFNEFLINHPMESK